MLNILKSIVFGVVQGITEWLPISSTGHLILMEQFMPIQLYSDAASNTAFWNMYKVVIQFGSILAVMLLYWHKLNPFSKKLKPQKAKQIWRTWVMILIATIPAAVIGFVLNDWIDEKMSTPIVIACTLIIYGVIFIWMENRQHNYAIEDVHQINAKNAFEMGMFQVLALIPGTSRSGSTIFGGTMLGFNRTTAAEFSFYMSISGDVRCKSAENCQSQDCIYSTKCHCSADRHDHRIHCFGICHQVSDELYPQT